MEKAELEEGTRFLPRFDAKGLIPCIVTSHKTKGVLMMAYMNEESLKLSLQSGEAHYWSRSRQEIWHKGATSGNVQTIVAMRTDCDQDCIWIEVDMPAGQDGTEVSCHTGRESCFYRSVDLGDSTLKF
ncbi:MAG: phosphoribosyl-AMP cyclohydrolase [Alphaproteobacteria bacterium]|nr:phosphoribosyl-AMP cyclohydrolase [Alphaproteobacteria bacterium]HCQ70900.1 phosphoribosyl-AMP cyclohydrolase [Rhodospirillaceae bacterium]|tara:strand:- start:65368 stop:65751 length:384 start_codon:yes stop_codon:yes gene_type:complete